MEQIVEQAYLYDFYGELLNARQQKIYKDFIFNDLSLSEIAEEEGISRQGVYDMVRRCAKTLESYEEKLHLVQKFLHTKERVARIHELTHAVCGGQIQAAGERAVQPSASYSVEIDRIFQEIEQISNEILEEW